MEQSRYLMWAKGKITDHSNSHINLTPQTPVVNPYVVGDSWEEQAFAEDANGTLGGGYCVWPPRSYSCSFCRREFRSAQALGGHMNVHRRDRARLKQLSPNNLDHPPHDQVVLPHQINHHAFNPTTNVSFDAPYSSPMRTFLYKNPNCHDFVDATIPKNVIRVSSPPPKNLISSEEKTSTLSFFSPFVHKNHVNYEVPFNPPSWSSFIAEKKDRCVLSSSKMNDHEKKRSRAEKEDCVTKDRLSVNLNMLVSQTLMESNSRDEEVIASCKRRKIESNSLSDFFPQLSAVDICDLHQSQVLKLRSSSTEELDLELRLGDAPKVK